MRFTLDSVAQAEACIKKEFPEKEIVVTNAILKTRFKPIVDPNIFYFGIVTVGRNCKAILTFQGVEFIDLDINSANVEIFDVIKYVDSNDVEIVDNSQLSLFRGFEILMK